MGLRILGTVHKEENREALGGVMVEAYDADLLIDDLLGAAQTDNQGRFVIECTDLNEWNDRPDIYLLVKSARGDILHSTRRHIIYDVSEDLAMDVVLGPEPLGKAGLENSKNAALQQVADTQDLDLKTWTLRSEGELNHPYLIQAYGDLEKHASILDLFNSYKQTLDRSADNNDPVYLKLAALFEAGRTPESVQGHFYGITLGVRCGDVPEAMADFGNLLGLIWGTTLSDQSPWVGKSLSPANPSRLQALTGQPPYDNTPVLFGINHFNRIPTGIANPLAFQLLNFYMHLHPSPPEERRSYNWGKNGANFIACPAYSVCAQSPRPVFQLNYRYKGLRNPIPNCWLVDELVEISPGLYLGQLCYATRKLLRDFDPQRPPQEYRYRNFGYFLLLDPRWHAEARRLFPFLEIPPNAPGMQTPHIELTLREPKFSTFTFEEPALPICNDQLKGEILAQAQQYPTLLHYLKASSQALRDDLANDSPYFNQLAELFKRGLAPRTMDGYYHGALVSWHSAGIFDLFGINTVNLLYSRIAAPFSTWTGKRFDPISTDRLRKITDDHESGQVPTMWGANTQSLRTYKERFVGRLMHLADIWTEKASDEETRRHGYDVKNFFFIARQAPSIDSQCPGKPVFQFNYRWPQLKTIIPDCFCIDELVQIAEGLFLGRLMYATNIAEPYDPMKDPKIYRYGLFGYFLLMDRQWHAIRVGIGFDLDNA